MDDHKLTVNSYNCQGFTTTKMPFIKELLAKSDLLFLQEHYKYKEQFDEFAALGEIGYHGSSGMTSDVELIGRPYGGTLIVWHSNSRNRITPIIVNSTRISAVTVTFPNKIVLLAINVYLPCDDRRKNDKYETMLQTLDDIQTIIASCKYDCLVVAGDMNCDFTRNSPHVNAMNEFAQATDLKKCLDHILANIPFTFESKATGTRSTIDHVFTDNDLFGTIIDYETVDSPCNLSDHCSVSCKFDMDVAYFCRCEKIHIPRHSWKTATTMDIYKYQNELDLLLNEIPLPYDALQCSDPHCVSHIKDIDDLNANIIQACLTACDRSIPVTKKQRRNHNTPGWNEFVKEKKQIACSWHEIWKESGRPQEGDIAEMRRMTRRDYHYAVRKCHHEEEKIRATRMAERLNEGYNSSFWSEVRKFKKSNAGVASAVDGLSDTGDIAKLFFDKFSNLFQSVPFDNDYIDQIRSKVNKRIFSDYSGMLCSECAIISTKDIIDMVKKFKQAKADGYMGMTTDCLIQGTNKLFVLLSLLFRAILTHGTVPSEFLIGTMSAIPKSLAGRNSSDNYRAITLSSIIGRLLDLIILEREKNHSLSSSNLQFGFKQQCSTTLCTGLLKEIATHFTSGGSQVYALFLDASKAFDRIEYGKLFDGLYERGMNSVYLRCLMNLYSRQKLRVKWNEYTTDTFDAKNGVKQGGILSPTLFSTYLDGLIEKLQKSGDGCYIGPYFCGVLAYADDICLLSPTLRGLKSMVKIAENFSANFKVKFNGGKSQLLVFSTARNFTPVDITVEGTIVTSSRSALHLGHKLFCDLGQDDLDSVIGAFNKQFNLFMSKFAKVTPRVKLKLFNTYCTSFYGIQLCSLGKLNKLHVGYRKNLRRLLKIPYRTHCQLIPSLAESLCTEHMFIKRFLKFASVGLTHDFPVVRYILRNSLRISTSLFASNCNYCGEKLDVQIEGHLEDYSYQVRSQCKDKCFPKEVHATAQAIKELLDCKYSDFECGLSYNEIDKLLNTLCTE